MTISELPPPFHSGETEVQNRLGVRSHVMSYAPKVIRPFMPDQHREFYSSQPFLVVAARDERDRMWSTLLTNPSGETGFTSSPSPTTLSVKGRPVPGDALSKNALKVGSDFGILGIELATKRRNRVNGRITAIHHHQDPQGGLQDVGTIEFRVDQSFGNCPQYIKPRRWWTVADKQHNKNKEESATSLPESIITDSLTASQTQKVREAETIFIATGHRGQGEDVRWGNDASHRGGPKGWVDVKDNKTVWLPDYSGNNHFNSIGNLMLDNRMGVTLPLFESGGMIQMTGTATVDFDEAKAAASYPGAKRIIVFSIQQVVQVPDGSLPIRWASNDTDRDERMLQVTQKIKESDDVTSFHLQAVPGDNPELWSFRPGQHLPISLKVNADSDQTLDRTYSLSGGADWGEYRISVKREPLGSASRYLHDNVNVGDRIKVHRPAGDFVLADEKEKSKDNERTLVLISGGIGVTPVLSMLHSFVSTPDRNKRRKVIWVHGARDGAHAPFQCCEVRELAALGGEAVKTHVVYSKPRAQDTEYDSQGHVDASLFKKIVPDLLNADFYMCGSGAFMADIEAGLEKEGVDSKYIQYETF